MNASGLRKKLIKGLIVDKWDLVGIIEKQEKEIKALRLQLKGYQTPTQHYREKSEEDWERTREYCS